MKSASRTNKMRHKHTIRRQNSSSSSSSRSSRSRKKAQGVGMVQTKHKLLKYLRDTASPLLPKPFKFSDKSKSILWKVFSPWHEAQSKWTNEKVFENICAASNMQKIDLSQLKNTAPSYESIEASIRAHIDALTHMVIYRSRFPNLRTKLYPDADIYVTVLLPNSQSQSHSQSLAILKHVFWKIYTWLYVLFRFSCIQANPQQQLCSSSLNIYLYLLDVPKQLPVDPNAAIGWDNVNTGFTRSDVQNRNNEIHIYRSYEWYKVFIHETFHAMGLDFAHDKKSKDTGQQMIQAMFPHLKLPHVNLTECYTETWAVLLHIMHLSFPSISVATAAAAATQSDSHHPPHGNHVPATITAFRRVLHRMEKIVSIEQRYICFQVVKIIRHNNQNNDIKAVNFLLGSRDPNRNNSHSPNDHSSQSSYEANNKFQYRENSSVFSYFILRSVLFAALNSFMEWCVDNNRRHSLLSFEQSTHGSTNSRVASFVRLFGAIKRVEYKECVARMEDVYAKMSRITNRVPTPYFSHSRRSGRSSHKLSSYSPSSSRTNIKRSPNQHHRHHRYRYRRRRRLILSETDAIVFGLDMTIVNDENKHLIIDQQTDEFLIY